MLALLGRDHFVTKALAYFNGGAQNEDDDAKWLAAMVTFKTPFVNAAIATKNINALLFAVSHNLTKKSDYDKIVEVATATQNTALKAAVLSTTAKPTTKEREKKIEKEFEKAIGIRALSVADIKKLWEYRLDEDGCVTLTKYIGNESIPTIPEKIGKAIVKRIGNQAIYMRKKIESIYIPEGIVAIGDYAFAENKDLAAVELPNSLIVAGKDLFKNCKSLKNVPNISTKTVDETDCEGKVQYDYCRFDAIKAEFKWVIDTAKNECAIEKHVGANIDIVVPEMLFGMPVTVIKRDAFSSGLTYSGNGAGSQQKRNKTIKSIKLPESIAKIEDYAFAGCAALNSLNIPKNCKVGKYVFLGCKKLAKDNRLVMFNGTLYRCIDSSAIYTEFSTTLAPYSVVVPSDVKVIAEYAFERCRALESVELSTSIIKIGKGAFNECSSLKNIIIPDSVKNIDKNVFDNCPFVVIRAKKGSYAEEFANANGIKFETV